jgi:hypothetical protein
MRNSGGILRNFEEFWNSFQIIRQNSFSGNSGIPGRNFRNFGTLELRDPSVAKRQCGLKFHDLCLGLVVKPL